jgi:hypothetical protein
MKQQLREIKKFEKIGDEEIYSHNSSWYAIENQHRDFQYLDKFGSEETSRRNMEGF